MPSTRYGTGRRNDSEVADRHGLAAQTGVNRSRWKWPFSRSSATLHYPGDKSA